MEEYITVFEAKADSGWFSWLYLIAIALGLIAFIWFIKPLIGAVREDGFRVFLKKKSLILVLFFALSLSYTAVMLGYTGVSTVVDRHRLYDRYVNGECDYVEGFIEDFHPMPEDLHDTEHFTVNGVKFSYGADNSEYFYSTCRKDGGILREGLYVRLWYFNADIGSEYPMSRILRIDVLQG
ncbi:MAG: hypothetical protein ACI3XR_01305 [Eubacteriales bacterium]